MPDFFRMNFPLTGGNELNIELKIGEILFILGANGAGKSSLVSKFNAAHNQHAKKIAAHRQTWFSSNTLDMTPQARDNLERNIKSQDQQIQARYRQEYAAERPGVAIYDLIDSDTMLERAIAALVRSKNIDQAQKKAETPSPLQIINELMRLSNIPIEITLEERQKIVARRNGGSPYSVAELSDGERNAFLIAADVLTAQPQTIIIIDEPERHLHRSIISPLLSLLFQQRRDCAFIVSTHDIMLPMDNSESRTLLVRSCVYEGPEPKSWTADLLETNSEIDDELKRDILGARKKILFVEGTSKSLDAPLYSIIFPYVSIIPKSSCRDVENAVKSLRDTKNLSWIHPWGIIDNDRRTPEEISALRECGVYSLTHYSVEALYYHTKIIEKIAARHSNVTGDVAEILIQRAIDEAIKAAQKASGHLIQRSVEKKSRQEIFKKLPNQSEIHSNSSVEISVDLTEIRNAEKKQFDNFINNKNLDALFIHYPLRESGALKCIADAIGITRIQYESAVRKLLQDDPKMLEFMRSLFGDLYQEISKIE